MEFKLFKLLSFIFLLFQLPLAIVHAKRDAPIDQNSSPFGFIKQLNGLHKGMNTKGVHQLKNYLKQFGYLDNPNQDDDDDFDDALESAIKTYQQNYHINPTGVVDGPTISKMIAPRCGVPDIVNGTNTMLKKDKHDSSSNSIHTVSHYSFFPGNPRWPASKTLLTYGFATNTPQIARDAVVRAFQKWDAATRFSFSPVASGQRPDLSIGFFRGDHGDGAPFDGRYGVLAHAFAPTNGRFHYDADEQWVVGSAPGSFDLESIAVHEIGHLLGLGHSSVQAAVMFSGIGAGQIKNVLQQDDIDGIRALYGS